MARQNEEDAHENNEGNQRRRAQGRPSRDGQRRRRPTSASDSGARAQHTSRRKRRPDSEGEPRPSQGKPERRRRPASASDRRRSSSSSSSRTDGNVSNRNRPNRSRATQRPDRRPASGNAHRRPNGARPTANRPSSGSPQILIAGGIGILIIVVLVLVIGRCTAKPNEGDQQAAQQQAVSSASTTEAQSSGSSSSSSSSSVSDADLDVKVPDPAWKKAAGVPDLTKQGTDPTKIAATMQAEREAANLKDGYKGVESPWVDGGYFTTGDKDLDKQVKDFCDKHSSKDKTVDENAYNTFCNITWSDYNEWEGNQYPRTYDWTVDYAKDFFSKGGNCFSMASAIQWCLRYFGYSDAHAELTYQERQSGMWLDHGLTWVTDKKSGEIKMVDSEMAANGWMMKPSSYSVEILDPTSNWEPRSSAFDVARN